MEHYFRHITAMMKAMLLAIAVQSPLNNVFSRQMIVYSLPTPRRYRRVARQAARQSV